MVDLHLTHVGHHPFSRNPTKVSNFSLQCRRLSIIIVALNLTMLVIELHVNIKFSLFEVDWVRSLICLMMNGRRIYVKIMEGVMDC